MINNTITNIVTNAEVGFDIFKDLLFSPKLLIFGGVMNLVLLIAGAATGNLKKATFWAIYFISFFGSFVALAAYLFFVTGGMG